MGSLPSPLLRGISPVHLSPQPHRGEKFTSGCLGQKLYLPAAGGGRGAGRHVSGLMPVFILGSSLTPLAEAGGGGAWPCLAGTGHPFSPDHIEIYCLSSQVPGIAGRGCGGGGCLCGVSLLPRLSLLGCLGEDKG